MSTAAEMKQIAENALKESKRYREIIDTIARHASRGEFSVSVGLPFENGERTFILKSLDSAGFKLKVNPPEDRPCGSGWVAEIKWS